MSNYQFRFLNPNKNLSITTEILNADNSLKYINIKFSTNSLKKIKPVRIYLDIPAIDIHYKWNPKIHLLKALNLDWFNNLNRTNAFTGAPVESLLNYDNKNKFTIALSDTLNTIDFKSYISEEKATYQYEIILFSKGELPSTDYLLQLRIDERNINYEKSLHDVALWWETFHYNKPISVPREGKQAMYSSWYSFHQNLNEEKILAQCKLAKKLHCESIIIDDGWQTDDTNRGYAFCGDWEVASSKINNIHSFVSKVHNEGLKILFWFPVPFIGEKSKIFNLFKDMLLDPINDREWYVLDPRYKEVREYIITCYEKAISSWNLDGLKLDFIDEFLVTPFSGSLIDERRDFTSLEQATDTLMKDCISRLKAIKPDIMLEFRQTYNGPTMRSYGNIFRAVDCPLDDLENRIRICDLRLISGNSAIHSDMIMWNKNDTAESAALQFINVLFSVPQISMLIDELSLEHRKMLTFFCTLWNKYRDGFINGSFEALNPHCRFNILKGSLDNLLVCSYHSSELIKLTSLKKEMVFINGSPDSALHLLNNISNKIYNIITYNSLGDVIEKKIITLKLGYNQIFVPISGVVILNNYK